MTLTPPLLTVRDLVVEYPGGFRRPPTRVIDGVGFDVAPGETVALVGESGSGKTTIGKAILGLIPVGAGRIELDGRDLVRMRARARRKLAGELQVIFQNPYGSLNPALSIGQILAEPLYAAGDVSKKDAREAVSELLARVHMPADAMDRYPADFSGGQRQRIAIARAVARRPRLIVCDEPTSALDVSTQAAVLDLLTELRETSGISYLFITHDLAVVRAFADRALVLRNGTIVEEGPSADVCERPQHPYTQRLVLAAPVPDPDVQDERRQRRLKAQQRELAETKG